MLKLENEKKILAEKERIIKLEQDLKRRKIAAMSRYSIFFKILFFIYLYN